MADDDRNPGAQFSPPAWSRRSALAGGAAASTLALAGCGTPAPMPEGGVRLRVADGFPSSHYIVELIVRPFMEKAQEMSRGRLQFDYYPSEQLGKLRDLLRLTQWGLMDIAYVVPAFTSEKMPLSSVVDLPDALGDDLGRGIRVFELLLAEGGFLRRQEFEPNGIRPLAFLAASANQLEISSNRRIDELSDIRGLKLRVASPATETLVNALGGAPIRMATAETFEALIRGTIDGLLQSSLSTVAYDLGEMLTQMTTDLNFGAVSATYSIREQTWRRIPPDLQEILLEAGRQASLEGCAEIQAREVAARREVLGLGVRPIEFSPEDLALLERTIDEVQRQWAQSMVSIGRPGFEALEALDQARAQVGIG